MVEKAKDTTGEWTPRPDPTLLTTEQLRQAVGSLREIIETRLDGMDKAIELVRTGTFDHVPALIADKVHHLADLNNEKFSSIQTQFTERDVRTEQTSKDSKVAIDAALASAEKLVGRQNESFQASVDKSERATSKLLDQQIDQQKSSALALESKISDLKDRLTRIEGMGIGKITEQTEKSQSSNWNLSIIMGLIAAGGLGLAIVEKVVK